MRTNIMRAGVIVTLASLAACTSGQVGTVPPSVSANLGANTLQLAVGTATIGVLSTGSYVTGTNVVATYRQPDGTKSGSLVNSPALTGPAGWTVPAGDDTLNPDGTGGYAPFGSGGDAGTTSLTSTSQATTTPSQTPGTTFGQTGGVFQYGFAPENSNNQYLSGTNFTLYTQPFFVTDPSLAGGAPGDAFAYQGGPPAYAPGNGHPNIRDGFYPTGFTGFTEGFTELAIAPKTGTYSLSLAVPSSTTSNTTATATATLASTTPLGPTTLAGFTRNADGGATVTVTVPAGATETVVNFVDRGPASPAPPTYVNCHTGYTAPFNYSVVVRGTGAQTATVPGTAGPIAGNGAQQPAFCAGDRFRVFAVAANYPLYESGPPQSTSAAPAITGANGQADISTAIRIAGTY